MIERVHYTRKDGDKTDEFFRWRCTRCGSLFLTISEAECHGCKRKNSED